MSLSRGARDRGYGFYLGSIEGLASLRSWGGLC
jgi:hypothetical protein